jgi:transcription initiation factor TFIIB
MEICPDCGSRNIGIIKEYEVICKECGLILEDSPFEINTFSKENKTSSASIPILAEAGGSFIDGKYVKNAWLYTTKEKNIKRGNEQIERIGARLKLTEVLVKEARIIYKLAIEKSLTKGRDNLSFIYASVYASCNIHCFPKTPLEIVAFTEMSQRKMLWAYRKLVQSLNLNVNVCNPVDLVPRFASKLQISQKTTSLAIEIVMKMRERNLTAGKSPSTIVATALYLASKLNGEQITQRMVANAVGVIEVTIRKRSREMRGLF